MLGSREYGAFGANVVSWIDGLESLLVDATAVASVALSPEIRLHLAADLPSLWEDLELRAERSGLPPPYWGVTWPGGIALARYVLDHPDAVRGLAVLDLGSGSGLCAIAAARSGAHVTAADTDPVACLAIAANAHLNSVHLVTTTEDVLEHPSRWDVVLAADLWYERFMAARVTTWLRRFADEGGTVFLGDLGRAYFPRHDMIERSHYRIEDAGSSEQAKACDARVWQFQDPRCSTP
jgi:predicted nicotinamide N-methyase